MSRRRPEPEDLSPLLDEEELDELDAFLMSDATSNEVMLLDSLDGYLTAIASGPVHLEPADWLPGIWGPSEADAPRFDSPAQQARILDLMTRHREAIVWSLQQEEEPFEPVFDLQEYEGDEHEYVDGEMWAYGYMRAIERYRAQWQPLFDAKHGAEMLRPIYLLGSEAVSAEEETLVETPLQREELTVTIPERARWLFKFWAPQRRAEQLRIHGAPEGAKPPRISRNAPCICGSGRKYKKCCGVDAV